MKKVLLALLLLIGVGVGVAYVQLGAVVKKGIETYGPRMLGAPVTVGLVTVSPFSGRGTVRGLKVGNPKGFESPSAIEVGELGVSIDVRSLLGGDRLVIHEITVDAPIITVETGPGGTNLQKLQANLASYAPSSPEEGRTTQGRKMEIGLFRLTGGKAQAVVPQLKSEPHAVKLPELRLEGIGRKSGGATSAEAARQVLSEVAAHAVKSAGGAQALLKKGLEAVGGDASKAAETLQRLFK